MAFENNNNFANFEQKLGEASEPEEVIGEEPLQRKHEQQSSKKELVSSAMKEDFDASFNPGFHTFGNFGGQSSASVLWGQRKN